MWTAATSGTSNASQHHIHEGVHLSNVTLKFVDPFVGTSFVVIHWPTCAELPSHLVQESRLSVLSFCHVALFGTSC